MRQWFFIPWPEYIADIAAIQLQSLQRRWLKKSYNYDIRSGLGKLSDAGYDPVYGVRPLKRVSAATRKPFSTTVVGGDFVAGDTIVDYEHGNEAQASGTMIFSRQKLH